jgi:hypothetical protein
MMTFGRVCGITAQQKGYLSVAVTLERERQTLMTTWFFLGEMVRKRDWEMGKRGGRHREK